MTARHWITIAVLATCGLVLIVWDLIVATDGKPGNTISEITLYYARRHPVIPFALGVIMGHLFWAQH